MNAPGKGLIKVVGILFIIFGAISLILSIVALIGSAMLLGAIFIVLSIVALIGSALELFVGILAVKNAAKPEKATGLLVWGIILAVLTIIPAFGGTTAVYSIIIGLALPVLLIIGAVLNKKALEPSVSKEA